MTIKETVKQALAQVPGNKPFSHVALGADPTIAAFEPTQIKRALRDIPYVRRLADGRYVVKGRKVPLQNAPKPAKIVKCSNCHKFATRNSQIDQELGICGRCAQTADRKAAQRTKELQIKRDYYAALADKYECRNCGTLSSSIVDGLCWRCQPEMSTTTTVENLIEQLT
jgi:hypothetical protein